MSECQITFYPQNRVVFVRRGTTLLDAAFQAGLTVDSQCGGEGRCKRCKMFVLQGGSPECDFSQTDSGVLERGMVLSCRCMVKEDLVVKVPDESLAGKIEDKGVEDILTLKPEISRIGFQISPLVKKIFLELSGPTLTDHTADMQRICEGAKRALTVEQVEIVPRLMKRLPTMLRKADYRLTATLAMKGRIAVILALDKGDKADGNYLLAVDVGTTTIAAVLICDGPSDMVGARSCFNSQSFYGREVTARMIAAERKGVKALQRLLVDDINRLIEKLTANKGVNPKDITGMVCSGNTIMIHFLLGLDTRNIRRSPYIPVTIEPPPLRAADIGIRINSEGMLYSLPGISGWVGGDITAGVLTTGIYEKNEVVLFMDIGTNGEIVVGNNEWMIACSASAGPALEGAGVSSGMRAEPGAVERVYLEDGKIVYKTVGGLKPRGICGSGIIDLISVLLKKGIINRSGKFINSRKSLYKLTEKVFITEPDIENIITAKAALFAAMKILLQKVQLSFSDIQRFYIAGAFGNYLNEESAISIGLIPNIPRNKIEFVGNTSLKGAIIAALSTQAFRKMTEIRKNITYYDLMGVGEYVEEFKKGLFLPHTNIEEFFPS